MENNQSPKALDLIGHPTSCFCRSWQCLKQFNKQPPTTCTIDFPSRTFIRSIPRLRTRNPLTKILSQWSIRRRGGILHLNNNTPFTIVFSIPSSIFSRSKTLQKCGALTLYAHVVYRPLFYPLMQIGSNLYRGGGDRIKRAGRGKAMVS